MTLKSYFKILSEKLWLSGKERQIKTLIVTLVVAVLISILFLTGFYSHIQLQLADFLYGGTDPLQNIVIVGIDDKSLQEIGRWPWERDQFAAIIDTLDTASVVGFDIGFFENSNPDSDSVLAKSMCLADNIVLPAEYTSFNLIEGKAKGDNLIEPLDELKTCAKAIGYINVITDIDGITRAINTDVSGKYNSFSDEIVYEYVGKRTQKTQRRLINYVGVPGSFKRYSFVDVLDGRIPKTEFTGKIVLIGATAPDLHDDYLTPTGNGAVMPGVEIHANIIQQFLTDKHLTHASVGLTIALIFLAALITAFFTLRFPVWIGAVLSLIVVVLYMFLTIFVFEFGLILNIIYVPITIFFVFLSSMTYYYLSEQKTKRAVLHAFGKYVSKEIIQHILEQPDKLKLGGQKRIVTVFFSDIRGFTEISEKLKPEQLVKLLNEYLSEMTCVVLDYNGVVDKYIGDAIMAFWNAPLDQKNHADLACKTAVEMQSRLKSLQKKWKKRGVPVLEMGIGINTGPAVVGNMGSYERFDYTVIGDAVNLGSRLEGLNKQHGTNIILSENTKQQLTSGVFDTRRIGTVKVKGKSEQIVIYELRGFVNKKSRRSKLRGIPYS